ncbi:hypothetical protein [Streptomyces swartbergensis]
MGAEAVGYTASLVQAAARLRGHPARTALLAAGLDLVGAAP